VTQCRHKKWWNFQNSFLLRDSHGYFVDQGGVSSGLIIEMLRHGLELIDSCYLRSRKNISRMFLKDAYLDYCLITFR
jgi:hypothetical protein